MPTKKVTNTIKSFTVDRKTWARGVVNDTSALLIRHNNKRCCLGFLGKACGVPARFLRDIATPYMSIDEMRGSEFIKNEETERKMIALWPSKLIGRGDDSALCQEMMSYNDDEDISEKQREAKLTKLFAKAGIAVKFTGKKPPGYDLRNDRGDDDGSP